MNSTSESQPEHSPSTLGPLIQALARLDMLLELAVEAARRLYGSEAVDDPYRGLYISPEQAARLLARQPGEPGLGVEIAAAGGNPSSPPPRRFGWLGRLFRNNHPEDQPPAPPPPAPPRETSPPESIPDILPLVRDLAPDSPLERLAFEYGLGPFDLDILILCLAPELDLRYERLYAFLQDDVTRRRPSVDLALNLLCSTSEEKTFRRQHFSAYAPLVRYGLIHLQPDREEPGSPLLAHYLQLDGQITNLLLGFSGLDDRLAAFAELVYPQASLETSGLEPGLQRGLHSLAATSLDAGTPLRLYFQGVAGSGRQQTAEGLANGLDMMLLVVDLPAMLSADRGLDWGPQLVLRAAQFQNAALYYTGFDTLRLEEHRLELQRFWNALLDNRSLAILAGSQPWEPVDHQPAGVVSIPFLIPGYERRFMLWEEELAANGYEASPEDLRAVAARFRLSQVQIAEAAAAAANLTQIEAGSAEVEPEPVDGISQKTLFTAARLQSGHELARLARAIEPRYQWEDLKLPPDSKQQLREIVQRVELREKVLVEWGFGQKHARGRGVTVLFAGPSGTGKTMGAEVIASELGLDLFRIDLSSVVSKYIGETEKNLERIFQAAENANAILLFDEADALFGKRSEVRDSHDRYANIEISYLLQKMEEYDGVAILATNLRQNLDESFVRRLAFTVSFPYPDSEYRREIWDAIWPEATKWDLDPVEIDYLSRSFRMAGGNIKNIAMAAAFLAAKEEKDVQIEHLLRATRREYQKMGKTMSDAELIGTLKEVEL